MLEFLREKAIITIGVVIVLVGFFVSYLVIEDYWDIVNSIHFGKDSNFADLGTALSGTVGLLFALASVIFFAHSLYQTKKETQDTKKLMERQLAETTFFNLINNHRDLIANTTENLGFHGQMNSLTQQLKVFSESINSRKFSNFHHTRMSPEPLYKELPNLEIIGISLIHIANLIRDRLNNDIFFHTTFYYGLSSNERFLIGMVIENKLEEGADKYKFDYTKNFSGNTYYINPDKSGYFPPLKLNSFQGQFVLNGLNQGYVKLAEDQIKKVTKIQIEGQSSIKLSYIEFKHYINNTNSIISFEDKNEFSFYDFVYSILINSSELQNVQPVMYSISFVFSGIGQDVTVTHDRKIRFFPINSNGKYIIKIDETI